MNTTPNIVLPKSPLLHDENQWQQNMVMVQMLCDLGTVSLWQDGEKNKDSYIHMPYRYEIEELRVEFLPHWDYYQIEDYHFKIRNTVEEIRLDLAAVKTIKDRGGRPAKQ